MHLFAPLMINYIEIIRKMKNKTNFIFQLMITFVILFFLGLFLGDFFVVYFPIQQYGFPFPFLQIGGCPPEDYLEGFPCWSTIIDWRHFIEDIVIIFIMSLILVLSYRRLRNMK